MTDQSLFDASNTLDPEKDYTEELIGEGKKFADVKGLARGKVEADRHIENLEKELSELREDLTKRVQVGELLEELKTLRNASEPNQPVEEPSSDEDTTRSERNDITSEDIEALVSKKLRETETQKTQESNYQTVRNELQKEWGSDFTAKLQQASSDLGMSPAEVDNLARTNPKLFLKAVGIGRESKVQAESLFTTSPQSAPQATRSEKNYAYYQKMRREDPEKYHSKNTQAEMHRVAVQMGESFYT